MRITHAVKTQNYKELNRRALQAYYDATSLEETQALRAELGQKLREGLITKRDGEAISRNIGWAEQKLRSTSTEDITKQEPTKPSAPEESAAPAMVQFIESII